MAGVCDDAPKGLWIKSRLWIAVYDDLLWIVVSR